MNRDRAEQTVHHLAAALSEALSVITQLFLHASILKAQGHPMASRYYREWVETMRRSDKLLEGIIALGGRPSSREPTHLDLGRAPQRILELDVAQGDRWLAVLAATAADCAAVGSPETASMLKGLRAAESTSHEWRRSQQDELADVNDKSASVPSTDIALLEALDDVLRAELSAITQVYYHGQLFEAWGEDERAEFLAKETWEKTWFSVELAERMLAAGGDPTEDGHGKLCIGGDVEEILDFDRECVVSQLAALGTALERCSSARNPEIHDLLSRIQVGEQKHADWIAAQLDAIPHRSAIHQG